MNFDTTAYLSNYLTTLLERCRSLTGLSDFATASPKAVEVAVKQHFPAITRADYERFFRTETVSTTRELPKALTCLPQRPPEASARF